MKNNITIDQYIKESPKEVQSKLEEMRKIISAIVPQATQTISYGLATFKLKRNLVHFGAFKTHIGFYPTPSGVEKFKKELEGYELSKATIRFPLNKPLPTELIQKIVKFRVQEELNKDK